MAISVVKYYKQSMKKGRQPSFANITMRHISFLLWEGCGRTVAKLKKGGQLMGGTTKTSIGYAAVCVGRGIIVELAEKIG